MLVSNALIPIKHCIMTHPSAGIKNPASLNPHVIPDRLHALDSTYNFNCFIDIGLGIDKATELNDTFESFDVDFCGFQGRFIEDFRFFLCGISSFIKIFPITLLP